MKDVPDGVGDASRVLAVFTRRGLGRNTGPVSSPGTKSLGRPSTIAWVGVGLFAPSRLVETHKLVSSAVAAEDVARCAAAESVTG